MTYQEQDDPARHPNLPPPFDEFKERLKI